MPSKRTGITVVMPGGGSRNFPKCGWVKTEIDTTGRITRTKLAVKQDGSVLGFAPPEALIVIHWAATF
jgi:hypothetical protein